MKKYLLITLISIIIALACASLPTFSQRTVKIAFTGDILLDRGVKKVIDKYGPDYPYEKVKNALENADIAFGNLECPVTDKGTPVLKRPYLIFRGALDNIDSLKNAGYDILNLANNHMMDYSHEGISDTMNYLASHSMAYVGAGSTREEAYKPVFFMKNGIKIGFLGYSDFPPEGYVYSKDESDISRTDEKMMHDCIINAKKQCDFLIVSFHWGTEYSFYPTNLQSRYAHEAVDLGADLVVGHHPHVLQSIEKYNNRYIFYSLGNFVFDKQIYPKTNESVILCVDIDKNGIKRIEILPVDIIDCQPEIDENSNGSAALKDILSYSQNKGAVIKTVDKNKLIIDR